ncbi:hypothetical protein [Paraflavitalea speifideaquila]|uniref:hypothetical protein n=1 Tax=Paraflavitalea speifideaquila TaxID=3076558 RepID=UPI0028E948C6|nr:hypothetical protein [Paraflavitalea speifideiaquila]
MVKDNAFVGRIKRQSLFELFSGLLPLLQAQVTQSLQKMAMDVVALIEVIIKYG